jgi:hypothetical protein
MTYGQPLSVIDLARAEESIKRIISRDDESGEVGKNLSSEIEEDKEKIKADYTKDSIDLWN